ncbi:HesA/MoeB/ThiF family protein [Geobacter argillaceus]|uniref:Molybdopterin/thiamine biosynthesis adenylyltransferase n=1 Tax=Geobacter argillaceus TaxID=345631 RepID=A0A562WSH3_9BACT|nr:HesA/MoeB/ThiF family protein [Geobacter argillaceus]TWJ33075.1 molybdopterin/thiamine biosynthesis adenylyltransferase [Geobacter argillaceus]
MSDIHTFLKEHASGDLVAWSAQQEAAERFNLTLAQIEAAILESGLLPARYQRNRQTVSTAGQLQLFRSRVAVIGCGGLGGYVIEELARLGVGQIVAIDPDRFEEHNLNRQLLSSPAALGEAKVTAAARRVGEINPAVQLTPVEKAFAADNGRELLAGARVVVDALDSIAVRLELADTCSAMGIPLVHGAIGGWYGHLATQLPGDDTLRQIYRSWSSGKGIEQQYGNPSFTPAVVASLQVAEVCKLLLGQGELLTGRQLTIDLLTMEIHEIQLRKADRSPA